MKLATRESLKSRLIARISGVLIVVALAVIPAGSNDLRGGLLKRKLPPHEGKHEGKVVLAFNTMVGVDGALVGSDAIRGVPGDELPWEIGRASGFLTRSGRLHVSVRGLVFPDEPPVPEELRGINDETEFRALVSVIDEEGAVQNLMTGPFPATRSGDSEINATVELPKYSFAPIVFILAGSEDKWFAVSGFEAEE